MNVTEDFIIGLNDRHRWDGIWMDKPSFEIGRETVLSNLIEAGEALEGKPAYYAISWAMGEDLIRAINNPESDIYLALHFQRKYVTRQAH